ncbi:MAG: dockerin type I repeat-containing protein [Phycisphaerales bacterium]|nr:dockerin type I repeat-containing protein [Phycisphaerales bacterium]
MRGIACVAAIVMGAGGASAQMMGIDFEHAANGLFSPNNWNVLVGSDYIVPNMIDESGAPTGNAFSMDVGLSFAGPVNPSTIPQHTQPLDGVDDYYYGTVPMTAEIRGLTPGESYNLWVFGLRAFAMNNRVEIQGGGSPVIFDQVASGGILFVNGEVGDSSRTLDSYAVSQTADASGLITILLTDDAGTAFGWTIGALAIAPGGPVCIPDLNGDGVVDADDFFLFLQLFAAGDLRADMNNDGVIDADDFFLFLNLFAQGC